MSLKEIKVPDIGDFKEVEIIEILVKAGDTIEAEQSLITVESDKASMEIPASEGGVVKKLLVKLGDKVGEGSAILQLDSAQNGEGSKAQSKGSEESGDEAKAPAKQADKSAAGASAGASEKTPEKVPAKESTQSSDESAATGTPPKGPTVVLGGGPGGYSAAFRAADLGLEVILIERYATLGGVCLNVGCIPSKALLHSAAVLEEAQSLASHGISFGKPKVDLDKLREFKSGVVSKLTGGLAGMAKARKVKVIQGVGQFTGPDTIEVTTDKGVEKIEFGQAIIAAGSQSVKLPFMPDDPRVVDSTGALELPFIPKRMLIVGGGIIGLEMGTVYSALGTRLDVVEMLDGLMPGADRDLVKVWMKKNEHRFDNIMLGTKTVAAEAKKDGIHVTFEGPNAPDKPQVYDLVLQAVGRSPNGKAIGADKAGVDVSDRGFISVDGQMRTNVSHIFAIGDIVGQPMLAHKAVHEAHVAAEVAAGQKSFFDARVIPSVAYTDPEVAWAGLTEEQARSEGVKIRKGVFPWAASGRAIANGRDEGFTKLLFDEQTGRIVGGAIVGTGAGDLISEVVLAIEMGADSVDIGKSIHPHPTLGESVGMAAEAADGHCTDLPPARKR
ncbi:dihydrolipoyl dehydrogenase [Orrella marina]|uniref:Dihydrolipoyl dehydrogenase n=1 Tax=Orrella marina TaxID=2163011 RepID=A0A2R4XGI0_9BURK|nr:dihydrolipoyl dehydrogenase [Orrella marina]AWB32930.1 dihydrolipoyl dehydrogenase [Orrella marina]